MTQTTVALTSQWLDAPGTIQPINTAGGNYASVNATCAPLANIQSTYQLYPNNQWGIWWYPYDGPARPIKLGLSEIARLKAAAKRDAKLKAILEKFTDLIQVTVDFE